MRRSNLSLVVALLAGLSAGNALAQTPPNAADGQRYVQNLKVASAVLSEAQWKYEPTANGRAYLAILPEFTAQTMKWFSVFGSHDDAALDERHAFFAGGELFIVGSIVMGRIPQDKVADVIVNLNGVNFTAPHGRLCVNPETRCIEFRSEIACVGGVLSKAALQYELKVHQVAMERTLQALAKRGIELESVN